MEETKVFIDLLLGQFGALVISVILNYVFIKVIIHQNSQIEKERSLNIEQADKHRALLQQFADGYRVIAEAMR